MQKRHSSHNHRIIFIISSIIAAIIIVYGAGVLYFSHSKKFLPNTVIEKTQVGQKTTSEAQTLIRQHIENQKINLVKNNKVVSTIKIADTGISSTSITSLNKAMRNQNAFKWPLQLAHVAQADESANVNPSTTGSKKLAEYTEQKANELNNNSKSTNGWSSSTNVNSSSSSEVDPHLLAEKIQSCLNKGKKDLDLKDTYPTKASKMAEIKAQKAKIAKEKAVYTINGTKVVIPNSTINGWLKVDNLNLTVDQSKVKSYLDQLNDKYATSGASVTFNSTKRGTQTVPGGTFGWAILTTTDAKKLSESILMGQDFTLKATLSGSGLDLKKGKLGSTYVEVDKTNQHMWFYKNGKQVISTDVVTGKPSGGNSTPSGVFFVWDKQRNATLRGNNDDGSKYASPVSYWMPIDYTGVGLHDANWQPTFGGDWYKTHGSHGCVNTPPSVMKQVFDEVDAGTPVIVF